MTSTSTSRSSSRRCSHAISTDRSAAIRPRNELSRLVPGWIRGYRRDWLTHDVVAGIVIWSVVVPQAVAYAQIAKLPPEVGLAAAPGALVAYALVGSSRTLVVSATTATSAVSASAVGAIVQGDAERFVALSATFALVVGVVLAAAGMLGLGGIADLVSKPVMTGFLFGLGLTITINQLPKLIGVEGGDGDFFRQAWALLRQLDDVSWWTLAVGAGSVALLIGLKRALPAVPSTLAVLALAIVVSGLFDLRSHGVAVVGHLPSAYPKPAWPDFRLRDVVDLLAPACGILLLTTEAVGVSRAIATMDGYDIDKNRELVAIGGSNLVAGVTSGFVQSGGASQTMAAENAGGKSQLATVFAAGLILLTGAFLAPLFRDLPEATLGAIIVVAIASFFRVDELRRFAHLRRSAIVLSLVALVGVLVLNVLPGLIVAAGLSLMVVIQRLSRPQLTLRHGMDGGQFVVRVDGPLFYANAVSVRDRVLESIRHAEAPPSVAVLDVSESPDFDVETVDMLAELEATLGKEQIELELRGVHARASRMLERAGLAETIRVVRAGVEE